MKIKKAYNRDKKRNKKKNGMRVSGRSIYTVIEIQVKKSEQLENERTESRKKSKAKKNRRKK